jgi:hypothetical protein
MRDSMVLYDKQNMGCHLDNLYNKPFGIIILEHIDHSDWCIIKCLFTNQFTDL